MAWVSLANEFVLLAEPQTMLQKLDPLTRARVLAALLGLIILGFGMMLLAWLGARVARRYRQRVIHRVPSTEPPPPKPAAQKEVPPAPDSEATDDLDEGS